jgi:hypothetical protein
MAYKVLNNIGLIDTSTNALTSLKTGLLVMVINKDTSKDPAFKDLNKVSKTYISNTISTHLKDDGSSVLLPQVNGTKAQSIMLVKGLTKDSPTINGCLHMRLIAKSANKLKAKDLSIMCGNVYPAGKDENWLIEMVAKTIESNV